MSAQKPIIEIDPMELGGGSVPKPSSSFRDTIMGKAQQYGLKMNSGKRSQQRNAAVGGSPTSYHLKGNAFDFSGDPENMRMFAQDLADNYGQNIAELYHGSTGYKRGQYVPGIPKHNSHVHIAFDDDGMDDFDVSSPSGILEVDPIEIGDKGNELTAQGLLNDLQAGNPSTPLPSLGEVNITADSPGRIIEGGRARPIPLMQSGKDTLTKGGSVSVPLSDIADLSPDEFVAEANKRYVNALGLSPAEAEAMKGSLGGDFSLWNRQTGKPYTPEELKQIAIGQGGNLDVFLNPETTKRLAEFKSGMVANPSAAIAKDAAIAQQNAYNSQASNPPGADIVSGGLTGLGKLLQTAENVKNYAPAIAPLTHLVPKGFFARQAEKASGRGEQIAEDYGGKDLSSQVLRGAGQALATLPPVLLAGAGGGAIGGALGEAAAMGGYGALEEAHKGPEAAITNAAKTASFVPQAKLFNAFPRVVQGAANAVPAGIETYAQTGDPTQTAAAMLQMGGLGLMGGKQAPERMSVFGGRDAARDAGAASRNFTFRGEPRPETRFAAGPDGTIADYRASQALIPMRPPARKMTDAEVALSQVRLNEQGLPTSAKSERAPAPVDAVNSAQAKVIEVAPEEVTLPKQSAQQTVTKSGRKTTIIPETDTLTTAFIKLGGINPDTMAGSDFANYLSGREGGRPGTMSRKGSINPEEMVQELKNEGYPVEDTNQLLDLLRLEQQGNKTFSYARDYATDIDAGFKEFFGDPREMRPEDLQTRESLESALKNDDDFLDAYDKLLEQGATDKNVERFETLARYTHNIPDDQINAILDRARTEGEVEQGSSSRNAQPQESYQRQGERKSNQGTSSQQESNVGSSFAYRVRDAGEKGIKITPQSRAQATMSLSDAQRLAESRSENPQEIVKIDLSKIDPSLQERIQKAGLDWMKFKEDVPEDAIEVLEQVPSASERLTKLANEKIKAEESPRSPYQYTSMSDMQTPRQGVALRSIGNAKRIDVDALSKNRYGIGVDDLNKKASSQFIDALKKGDVEFKHHSSTQPRDETGKFALEEKKPAPEKGTHGQFINSLFKSPDPEKGTPAFLANNEVRSALKLSPIPKTADKRTYSAAMTETKDALAKAMGLPRSSHLSPEQAKEWVNNAGLGESAASALEFGKMEYVKKGLYGEKITPEQQAKIKERQVREGGFIKNPFAKKEAEKTPPSTLFDSSPDIGKKGQDFKNRDRFRSRLSNLESKGVYERRGGEIGLKASELFRQTQVDIGSKKIERGAGIAKLERDLQPIKKALIAEGKPGLAQAIDRHLEAIKKKQDPTFANLSGLIKSFHFNTKLRFNPKSAFLNVLQPLNTLYPHVNTSQFLNLMMEARKPSVRKKYADLVNEESGSKVEGEATAKKSFIPDMFSKASTTNKIAGYLYGLREAKRQGLDADKSHRLGMDWAKKVEFDNSEWDVPEILSGEVAGVLGQFKGFTIKNLESIANDLKKHEKDRLGGYAARVGKRIGAQLVLGGVRSVPGAKALGGLIVMGSLSRAIQKTGVPEDDANKYAEAIYYGMPSLIGEDLSGSMMILDPPYGETTKDKLFNFFGGPSVSAAMTLTDAADKMGEAKENTEKLDVAKKTVKKLTPYYNMADSAIQLMSKGKVQLEAGADTIDLNTFEGAMRTLGFTPVKQAQSFDKKQAEKDSLTQAEATAKQNVKDKMPANKSWSEADREAYRLKSDIEKLIKDGEIDRAKQQVKEAIKSGKISEKDADEIGEKAKSPLLEYQMKRNSLPEAFDIYFNEASAEEKQRLRPIIEEKIEKLRPENYNRNELQELKVQAKRFFAEK